MTVDTDTFKRLLGEYSLSLEQGHNREANEERYIAARWALVAHLNAELEAARTGAARPQ